MNKKQFKEFMIEDLKSDAWVVYNAVYPDLPKYGNSHWISAVEFCAGQLYDSWTSGQRMFFERSWFMVPGIDPKWFTEAARKCGIDDDRAQTSINRRLAKRKEERKRKASLRVKKETTKQTRIPAWDDKPPRNKGIGSR